MPLFWGPWARFWGVTTVFDVGGPRGIGGWLIVPVFGHLQATFECGVGIVQLGLSIVSAPPGLSIVSFMPAVGVILFLLGMVLWGGAIFRDAVRHTSSVITAIPTFMVVIGLWACASTALGASFGPPADIAAFAALGRAVTWTAIWTWYMHRSVRVRNTFIR